MKIDKSRLLFLRGDTDEVEIDPGIRSPSNGNRSPIQIEMALSETYHSSNTKRRRESQKIVTKELKKFEQTCSEVDINLSLDMVSNDRPNKMTMSAISMMLNIH